jgi:hypothetical protein
VVAVVEVKALEDLSVADASFLRTQLLAQSSSSSVPYFLGLSADRGFLWVDGGTESQPAAQFSMAEVTTSFRPQREASPPLRGSLLEAVIGRWLRDLTFRKAQQPRNPAERVLAQHGVIDAISGGSVARQATVEDAWMSTSSPTSF